MGWLGHDCFDLSGGRHPIYVGRLTEAGGAGRADKNARWASARVVLEPVSETKAVGGGGRRRDGLVRR